MCRLQIDLYMQNASDTKRAGKGKNPWTCSYIVKQNSQLVNKLIK
jgi:hypothetical protein